MTLPQLLRDLVRQYGQEVCHDPDRVKGLLNDLLGKELPAHKQRVNVLVLAVEHQATQALLASRDLPMTILGRRVASRLRDELGMQDELATWAVATWGFALGLSAVPPVDQPACPSPPRTAPVSVAAQPANLALPTTPGTANRPGRRRLACAVGVLLLLLFSGLVFAFAMIGREAMKGSPTDPAGLVLADSRSVPDKTPTTTALPPTRALPPETVAKQEPKQPVATLRLLAVAPVILEARRSQTAPIQLERQNCRGPVELRLENVPAGVSARPGLVSAEGSSGLLEVTAGSESSPGVHWVRLLAVAADARAEVEVRLEILPARVEPPPPPVASLKVLPIAPVSIEAGQDQTFEIRLERQNCRGPVELRLDGLPDGVSAASGLVAADADAGSLNLRTGTNTAQSISSVRLRAVAADAHAETEFRISVRPPDERRIAAIICAEGRPLLKSYQYARAIGIFDEAVRRAPNQATSYAHRAAAHADKEDYDKTWADCNQALHLDPDCALAYVARSKVWIKSENYQRALEDSEKAIRLEPNLALAHAARAWVYNEQRQHSLALACANEAIRLDPELTWGYNHRAWAYWALREYDYSIEAATKAIELAPRNPYPYNHRGAAYYFKGYYDEAISDSSEAIRLHPGYSWAYYNRSGAYQQKGDAARSRADYERAIQLNPRIANR